MILEVIVGVLVVAVVVLLMWSMSTWARLAQLERREEMLREWIDETDEWCNETTDAIDGLTVRVIRLEHPAEPPTQVESFSTQLSRDLAAKRAEKERLMRENKENANG